MFTIVNCNNKIVKQLQDTIIPQKIIISRRRTEEIFMTNNSIEGTFII